jgi:hypothetical protein
MEARLTAGELARMQRLIPEARERIWRVIEGMAARGFDVYVGQTSRSSEEVAKAAAEGRASVGMKHDWHQLNRAADLRRRAPDGGVNFDQGPASEPFWRALYEEATKHDLRSLAYRDDGSKLIIHAARGDIWDSGHVEYRYPYATLAEAVAAELAPG